MPAEYLAKEIAQAEKRLNLDGVILGTTEALKRLWSMRLYRSVDGAALCESAKTPQQHRWVAHGSRFLTGRDFINLCRLRINALPTRSRTTRGRMQDRRCRAGCLEQETLNHVLQVCHRTHAARIKRHNARSSYIANKMRGNCLHVEEEPRFQTSKGLRKPDIIAKTSNGEAVVIDVQVLSEQMDLNRAHKRKADYYRLNTSLRNEILQRYNTTTVIFETVTVSCRGIWISHSAQGLMLRNMPDGIKRENLRSANMADLVVGYLT